MTEAQPHITRKPIELFYSYAQEDEVLCHELETHLANLRQRGFIKDWHRGKITPGQILADESTIHLQDAQIILLLLSPDFIAHDHLYGKEVQYALERNGKQGTRVIPILLRRVDLEGSPLKDLAALPTNGQPVLEWKHRDAAFVDIIDGIRKAISDIASTTNQAETPDGIAPHTQTIQTKSNTLQTGILRKRKSYTQVLTTSPRIFFTSVGLLVIISFILISLAISTFQHSQACGSFDQVNNANMQGQECIGISDGGYRLDNPQNSRELGFTDNPDMAQASQAYRDGNSIMAKDSWEKAKGEEHDDAEPLVYLQDQSVSMSAQNYYDLIVVTVLSGTDEGVNIGRNELRGFYIALNDYNSHRGQNMPLRFLIANVGNMSNYASQIEVDIKNLAKTDQHLIGILGWPISGVDNQVINVIHDLTQTGLPIISPTATADELSQQNSYFFRMAPTNEIQAEADVRLIETAFQRAHPSIKNIKQQIINVAVLVTNHSPYSSSLYDDFRSLVGGFNPNIHITSKESYNIGDTQKIQSEIDAIVKQNLDIIYLPGYSQDAQTVLQELQATDSEARIKVVGGDGLSYVHDYPYSAYPSQANNRLYYTSFTTPSSDCQNHEDDFYSHYYETFNICPANDAMLAYDTAMTMFWAINQMHYIGTVNDINILRDNLWNILKGINDLHPLSIPEMVTGKVTFRNGERIDLIIKAFFVGSDGKIHLLL